MQLKKKWIETPLGPMLAISDEHHLHLLEFKEYKHLDKAIQRLQTHSRIIPGEAKPIALVQTALDQYFEGALHSFDVPLFIKGTPFQKKVWEALQKIPLGETRAYLDLAKTIGNPLACRAVAKANSTNQFAIIVPCHRVINANGLLGGYAGGVMRKQWLLDHEKRMYTHA